MSSVTVEKETNLISGQPPNTVDGRLDAAMDTMQLALLQLLRTLLFVIVRVSKNVSYHELSCPMYYSNHCSLALPQNTKAILVWFLHSFSNITFGENGSWFLAKMAFRQLCRDDAQLPCEHTNTPYLVDSFPRWTIKALDLSTVHEYVIMRPRHFLFWSIVRSSKPHNTYAMWTT